MKRPEKIPQTLEAWVIRFMDWDFSKFEKPVTTELGAVEGQNHRRTVRFVRARRAAPLDKSKGEVLVMLENCPDSGKVGAFQADLKRRTKEIGKSIKEAYVQTSGDLLFTFDCSTSERTPPAPDTTDFLVYRRDESKYLFEAVDAVREVFEILGIDEFHLRNPRLYEQTLVTGEDGTWIGLEKFLMISKGLRE
ncbi:MAG: hypothetical protein V1696_04020 [Candidatus Jorgensenbacteria bacterium]